MTGPPSSVDRPHFQIHAARDERAYEQARHIFAEYGQSLSLDLEFQNFDEELRQLPGEYVDPYGVLLLAKVDDDVAGCCALRPLVSSDYANACELKRLYVRKPYRGFGLGRQLTEAVLDAARRRGYSTVLLDTLDVMESARALYQDLGFEDIPPYYYNPLPGARYLKATL
ncbi:MAG: Mycothiol acetyltransferase [Paracidovorax wautersii]|uniref:Mycothiol acetyltransferase n=1 Tax=Paracidovorax wautersii TaxID=1177982 RepID=A0A7V8FKZ7_9BURK|nr:MAG: Mycothiol acetyltransferase [Paracidovorax wautersii]